MFASKPPCGIWMAATRIGPSDERLVTLLRMGRSGIVVTLVSPRLRRLANLFNVRYLCQPMRLGGVFVVLLMALSGCTTLSEPTQVGTDLCPLVEPPTPRPTIAGGTPVPPDTTEPSPGRTPAYTPPDLAEEIGTPIA